MRRQTSSSLGVLTRVASTVECELGHQLDKGEVSADQITLSFKHCPDQISLSVKWSPLVLR